MKPQAGDCVTARRDSSGSVRPPSLTHRRGRPAFSLAELMIALAILAMGLLVIGAALPAGARFSKDSMDMVTGAAASEYALDVIQQSVCLRDKILDPSDNNTLVQAPALFQPRLPAGAVNSAGQAIGGRPSDSVWEPPMPPPPYEPLIKVRPLFTQNIKAKPGATHGYEFFDENVLSTPVWVEKTISTWVDGWLGAGGNETKEYDPSGSTNPWLRPAISSVSLVYPPISADSSADMQFLPVNFFNSPYTRRPVYSPDHPGPAGQVAETLKALERRVVWTAFYRRVSYAPNSDSALYELIVVTSRLPSPNHRFPVQDYRTAAPVGPTGTGHKQYSSGNDCVAPIPWLVSFRPSVTGLPTLRSTDYTIDSTTGERVLTATFVPPATLTFETKAPVTGGLAVGSLLPVGSILIPAVNDRRPSGIPGQTMPPDPPEQWAGFVPSAPDALPIYEVTQRIRNADDSYQIIVKNNGYYPWVNTDLGKDPASWPVWVIPPAMEASEVGQSGEEPILGDRSPVLSVARRYVQLKRLP